MRKQDIAKLAPGTKVAWGYEPCKLGQSGIHEGTLVSAEPTEGHGAYARYSVETHWGINRVRSAQIVGTWEEHSRIVTEDTERRRKAHAQADRQAAQRLARAARLRGRLKAIGTGPIVTVNEWVHVKDYEYGNHDFHFDGEVALIVRGEDIERLISLAELGARTEHKENK